LPRASQRDNDLPNVLEEFGDGEDFDLDAQNSLSEALSLQGPSRRSSRSGGHAVAAAGPAMRSSSSAAAPPAAGSSCTAPSGTVQGSNACGSAPVLMDGNAHSGADDAASRRASEGRLDDSDDDADRSSEGQP
jgi:hypothetical protein